MENIKNKKAFSTILSLLIIGFLLLLTTGVFNLVLRELNDNRWIWNYLRSYSAAEGSQELALLMIKENGYWYYDKIDDNINPKSIMLSENPFSSPDFKSLRDPIMSYEISSSTDDYSSNIDPLSYKIIPLFVINNSWESKATNLDLVVNLWSWEDLVWNIIWDTSWISWTGSFNADALWYHRYLTPWNNFRFEELKISDFLTTYNSNYLVLFNSSNNDTLWFNLKSLNPTELFSKPEASIFSSARIWDYKQNLVTNLDNTSYLWMLKYSIFSN